MHKGLVVIYDSHALMQFLQLYCINDYEAEWDALCLPSEGGNEIMHASCEKAGVFKHVYTGNSEYITLGLFSKLLLFLKMCGYAVTGQRKKFAANTLNSYVDNIEEYDILVANSENGFISGMLSLFALDKVVIYMEDGVGDYINIRKKWKSFYRPFSFENFQSVLMARLGYFGKGYTYLKTSRYAIKYASVPDELLTRHYRDIRQLKMDEQATNRFKILVEDIYPELSEMNISEETAVVFTDLCESDCVNEWQEYLKLFIKSLERYHSDILLKCHPREDAEKYVFSEHIKTKVVPKNIPAELILPYLDNNKCYFMMPNSIILNMRPYNISATVLYNDMTFELMQQNEMFDDVDSMKAYCRRFLGDNYEFIKIE